MFGFAEFEVVSAGICGAFCSATALRISSRRGRFAVVASAIVFALSVWIKAYFAPRAWQLLSVAALLVSSLLTAHGDARKIVAVSVAEVAAALVYCGVYGAFSSYGQIVAVASAGAFCLVGHFAVCAVCAAVARSGRKRDYGAEVNVSVAGRRVNVAGFWDSGNSLTFRGMEPVVVVGADGAGILDGARVAGQMIVSSVCGKTRRTAYFIDELTVRDADGEKSFKDVVAIGADSAFDGFKILLNCGLNG